ncbi:hypothetical protein HPB51_029311 [Rhipicephalus microplus]|uniref:Transposable element P transposase-like GTP-binding insertion domain-containing protein n=1 Tax=Rhipicephalus microplus TaxID=6941 RepID=A0A9J6CUN5_RHIMP|nr:hypothetical protein HPB51_029311 [Rhipicephalus microplus]
MDRGNWKKRGTSNADSSQEERASAEPGEVYSSENPIETAQEAEWLHFPSSQDNMEDCSSVIQGEHQKRPVRRSMTSQTSIGLKKMRSLVAATKTLRRKCSRLKEMNSNLHSQLEKLKKDFFEMKALAEANGALTLQSVKGDHLHQLTLEVIKSIEEAGFQVVRLVADNHASNKKMFTMLGNGRMMPVVPHPMDMNRRLFLSFDHCHILKNLRNQMLSTKRVLFNNGHYYSPTYLRKLLDITEKQSSFKLVRNLTQKHVYPTNFEKLSVKRAVEVFSPQAYTESLYTEATQRVTQRYGKDYTWEVKSAVMGTAGSESTRIIIDRLQLPLTVEELEAELHQMHRELFPTAQLMPGEE